VAGSPCEIRAFTSLLVQKRRLFFLKGGSNGDQTGPLGERGELSVGKVGESDVESQRLQGANPCLCRLRTNRLVPANKY
jgi:hypothetical protein